MADPAGGGRPRRLRPGRGSPAPLAIVDQLYRGAHAGTARRAAAAHRRTQGGADRGRRSIAAPFAATGQAGRATGGTGAPHGTGLGTRGAPGGGRRLPHRADRPLAVRLHAAEPRLSRAAARGSALRRRGSADPGRRRPGDQRPDHSRPPRRRPQRGRVRRRGPPRPSAAPPATRTDPPGPGNPDAGGDPRQRPATAARPRLAGRRTALDGGQPGYRGDLRRQRPGLRLAAATHHRARTAEWPAQAAAAEPGRRAAEPLLPLHQQGKAARPGQPDPHGNAQVVRQRTAQRAHTWSASAWAG